MYDLCKHLLQHSFNKFCFVEVFCLIENMTLRELNVVASLTSFNFNFIGVNVNDGTGMAPLHRALECNNSEVCKLLIDNNAGELANFVILFILINSFEAYLK